MARCEPAFLRRADLLDQGLQVVAHLAKGGGVGVVHAQVAESVREATTHEELHGQEVHPLGILIPAAHHDNCSAAKSTT